MYFILKKKKKKKILPASSKFGLRNYLLIFFGLGVIIIIIHFH